MRKIKRAYMVLMLLLLVVVTDAHAESYNKMKEKAKDGGSDVFETFVSAFGQETKDREKAILDDYSDLTASYESAKLRDLSGVIFDKFVNSNSKNIERWMNLSESDIQEMVSDGLSDQDVLEIIVLRSNRISKAKSTWDAALNYYPQTQYLQELLRAYNPFSEGMSLGVGKEYQREMIQMYHPVDGMLSLRGKAVDLDVEIAWQDYIKSVRDVVSDTGILLSQIRNKDELVVINTESANLLGVLYKVAQAQYKAGTTSFADLIRLKTELDKRVDRVDRLSSMRAGLVAKLLGMMDLPVDNNVGLIKWSDGYSPKVNSEKLGDELVASRQELQILEMKVEKMDVMIKMAGLRADPDSTFGFSYFQGRDVQSENDLGQGGIDMSMGDMSGMSSDMNMSSMDFMNRPMVDHRALSYASDMAWAVELIDRRSAMESMYQAKIDMDSGMLEMLLTKYGQLISSEKVYTSRIIPDSKAAMEVVRKGYSAGQNNFNDLIGTELALLMARMESSNISKDRRIALIELERLFGGRIQDNRWKKEGGS